MIDFGLERLRLWSAAGSLCRPIHDAGGDTIEIEGVGRLRNSVAVR